MSMVINATAKVNMYTLKLRWTNHKINNHF